MKKQLLFLLLLSLLLVGSIRSSAERGNTTSCHNSIQDSEETDADCGGVDCDECLGGMGCEVDADCFSEFCFANNTCASVGAGVTPNPWFDASTEVPGENLGAWKPQSVLKQHNWDRGANYRAVKEYELNYKGAKAYVASRCEVKGIKIGKLGARCMGRFVLHGPMLEMLPPDNDVDDATPVYRMVKGKKAKRAESKFLHQASFEAIKSAQQQGETLAQLKKTEMGYQSRVKQALNEFDSTLWLIRIAKANKWIVAHRTETGVVPCVEVHSKATKPQDIQGDWKLFDMSGNVRAAPGVTIKCSSAVEPVFGSKKQLRDYEVLRRTYFTPSKMPTRYHPPTPSPTHDKRDIEGDLYDFTNPYLHHGKHTQHPTNFPTKPTLWPTMPTPSPSEGTPTATPTFFFDRPDIASKLAKEATLSPSRPPSTGPTNAPSAPTSAPTFSDDPWDFGNFGIQMKRKAIVPTMTPSLEPALNSTEIDKQTSPTLHPKPDYFEPSRSPTLRPSVVIPDYSAVFSLLGGSIVLPTPAPTQVPAPEVRLMARSPLMEMIDAKFHIKEHIRIHRRSPTPPPTAPPTPDAPPTPAPTADPTTSAQDTYMSILASVRSVDPNSGAGEDEYYKNAGKRPFGSTTPPTTLPTTSPTPVPTMLTWALINKRRRTPKPTSRPTRPPQVPSMSPISCPSLSPTNVPTVFPTVRPTLSLHQKNIRIAVLHLKERKALTKCKKQGKNETMCAAYLELLPTLMRTQKPTHAPTTLAPTLPPREIEDEVEARLRQYENNVFKSKRPTRYPTAVPTSPTASPTSNPTVPTSQPSAPTKSPTHLSEAEENDMGGAPSQDDDDGADDGALLHAKGHKGLGRSSPRQSKPVVLSIKREDDDDDGN
jgi:hypothetical protein